MKQNIIQLLKLTYALQDIKNIVLIIKLLRF